MILFQSIVDSIDLSYGLEVWLPTECLTETTATETKKTAKRQKDTATEKAAEELTSKRQRTSE